MQLVWAVVSPSRFGPQVTFIRFITIATTKSQCVCLFIVMSWYRVQGSLWKIQCIILIFDADPFWQKLVRMFRGVMHGRCISILLHWNVMPVMSVPIRMSFSTSALMINLTSSLSRWILITMFCTIMSETLVGRFDLAVASTIGPAAGNRSLIHTRVSFCWWHTGKQQYGWVLHLVKALDCHTASISSYPGICVYYCGWKLILDAHSSTVLLVAHEQTTIWVSGTPSKTSTLPHFLYP